MALIVQDPLNPTEEANSYKSLADWRTRAAELGLSLDADDTKAKVQVLTGMLYVDTSNLKGETVIAFQGTAFPRRGITSYINGELVEYSDQKVPQQAIDAVLYVAVEDNVYLTTQGGQRIKVDEIDVIKTEYFDDGVNAVSFKRVAKADALLSKFTARSRPSQIVYAV